MYLDLDPLSQMIPKQKIGVSKRHPPRALVLEASLNDTFRRVWSFQASLNDTLRGFWAFWACIFVAPRGHACQACLNDTLRGGRAHFQNGSKIEPKSTLLGVAIIFFFKRPLPRVVCPLNETLRGVGGPTVASPRAEGGGGRQTSPTVSPTSRRIPYSPRLLADLLIRSVWLAINETTHI